MLHRYSGDRFREHFGTSADGNTTRRYGLDTSGAVSYRFDALGFRRGESAASPSGIYACGCSYTFGEGLNFEASWPHLFSSQYGRHGHGGPGVTNFSQGGASNAYIARTLITQSTAVPPAVVIVLFSHIGRTEYYVSREERERVRVPAWSPVRPENLGTVAVVPKYSANWFKRRFITARLPAGFRNLGSRVLSWTRHYYLRTYTDLRAVAESLTNMLALQYFCESRGIEFLVSWVDHACLEETWVREHPAVAPMVKLLNAERFVDFSLLDDGVLVDRAADGWHPGPESNAIFARRMWERFERLASKKPRASVAASA
jgi:hypothetical protein